MIGALMHYITHVESGGFQPMKANFGLLPHLGLPTRDKQMRQSAYAARALSDLEEAISAGRLVPEEPSGFAWWRDR
jgi:methylenetetrahydrofolate--tRNA-(uracil-5-)-methyltransferase